jgi:hypothetical protein
MMMKKPTSMLLYGVEAGMSAKYEKTAASYYQRRE